MNLEELITTMISIHREAIVKLTALREGAPNEPQSSASRFVDGQLSNQHKSNMALLKTHCWSSLSQFEKDFVESITNQDFDVTVKQAVICERLEVKYENVIYEAFGEKCDKDGLPDDDVPF